MNNEQLFERLYLIRRVEEEIARVYPSDKIKSPVHLSIGQEAASVGVCGALDSRDVVFGSYRGHALYLAKGGDLKAFVAELYGKVTGCSKGKGGSMHLADPAAGVMGTSAVVATTIPHAAGYALALQLRGEQRVVASFFGDGATEEGVFYETLNFATLKKLPVLFVCENNFYAIHSPLHARQAASILDRARGFGLTCDRVENGDVHAVLAKAEAAVAAIRAGLGPRFLEVVSYRWKEHVGPGEDFAAGYRSAMDAARWRALDPVSVVGSRIASDLRGRIERAVEERIREAFEFAERSPEPRDHHLYVDLYAEGTS